MPRIITLCGILIALPAGPIVAAADSRPGAAEWPQFRGPHRDAVSPDTGLLRQWPKQGPPLAWKTVGVGVGYSSIAIADGKIFTLGDRAKDGGERKAYVTCLDEATGKEVWATRVGERWSDGGTRSTPTVDGDRVYALTPHGDLVCLDTASGKERWRKNLPKDFGGQMMSGWGYSESPLIDGEKLVCTPGGSAATLVALNKQSGAVLWKSTVPGGDGAAYSSIVIAEVGGVRQYVQLLGRGIVGVAAKDGRFLWRYDRIANGTANIPTPIVRGDLVFCSTGYNTGSALLRLVPSGGQVDVKEVYFLPASELQNHHGGLVLVGDYIYGGHGHNQGAPVCVELKTGKIVWRKEDWRRQGPGSGSAAVVYADGCLYFRYENGVMALIEATPEGYHEKGRFNIPEVKGPSWPHPVVSGGKLYLREGDVLLCYDVRQR